MWLGPFKISNIPRTGTMTLEDKNCEAIGNYREHNLKKCYPAENEKQQEDERQENENGNEMNGQKGHSENGNNEKQLEDEGQENKNGNKMIVKLMKTTTIIQLMINLKMRTTFLLHNLLSL